MTDRTSDRNSDRISTGRMLTFALDGQEFALPLHDVTEIVEYRTPTAVPMMPGYVRGVVNLRGRVVPVVDLAERLGLTPARPGRRTSIVIVGARGGADVGAGRDIGLIVDTVHKVVELPAEQVEPAPAFGAGIRADFIAAMGRLDEDFLIVLDVAAVLTAQDADGSAALRVTTPEPVAAQGIEPVAQLGAAHG